MSSLYRACDIQLALDEDGQPCPVVYVDKVDVDKGEIHLVKELTYEGIMARRVIFHGVTLLDAIDEGPSATTPSNELTKLRLQLLTERAQIHIQRQVTFTSSGTLFDDITSTVVDQDFLNEHSSGKFSEDEKFALLLNLSDPRAWGVDDMSDVLKCPDYRIVEPEDIVLGVPAVEPVVQAAASPPGSPCPPIDAPPTIAQAGDTSSALIPTGPTRGTKRATPEDVSDALKGPWKYPRFDFDHLRPRPVNEESTAATDGSENGEFDWYNDDPPSGNPYEPCVWVETQTKEFAPQTVKRRVQIGSLFAEPFELTMKNLSCNPTGRPLPEMRSVDEWARKRGWKPTTAPFPHQSSYVKPYTGPNWYFDRPGNEVSAGACSWMNPGVKRSTPDDEEENESERPPKRQREVPTATTAQQDAQRAPPATTRRSPRPVAGPHRRHMPVGWKGPAAPSSASSAASARNNSSAASTSGSISPASTHAPPSAGPSNSARSSSSSSNSTDSTTRSTASASSGPSNPTTSASPTPKSISSSTFTPIDAAAEFLGSNLYFPPAIRRLITPPTDPGHVNLGLDDPRSGTCSICGRHMRHGLGDLSRHILSHIRWPSDGADERGGLWRCNGCTRGFSRVDSLERHCVKYRHSGQVGPQCRDEMLVKTPSGTWQLVHFEVLDDD
ncbi:hypothetical protein HDZ31DRAFT_63195 [Schizophyllum fasciatum]